MSPRNHVLNEIQKSHRIRQDALLWLKFPDFRALSLLLPKMTFADSPPSSQMIRSLISFLNLNQIFSKDAILLILLG